MVVLEQYDLVHMPQRVVKGRVLLDFLANYPVRDDWELNEDLPGQEVLFVDVLPHWKMYFDGAA